jgi:hypothetical protein
MIPACSLGICSSNKAISNQLSASASLKADG